MECRNTDRTLHENVDCRIIWTEQHALGIDVGGHVITKDPVRWHELETINAELLAACEGAYNMIDEQFMDDLVLDVADQLRAAIKKAKVGDELMFSNTNLHEMLETAKTCKHCGGLPIIVQRKIGGKFCFRIGCETQDCQNEAINRGVFYDEQRFEERCQRWNAKGGE